MIKPRTNEIVFKHLVDLPNCDCVFCSAEERFTGRSRLFLIFNHQGRIYSRNGINGTWDEMEDEEEINFIRQKFTEVIEKRDIPCFTT